MTMEGTAVDKAAAMVRSDFLKQSRTDSNYSDFV